MPKCFLKYTKITGTLCCVLLFCAGCDALIKPTPKAVLLVTWLVPRQPPVTTNTPITDMETCEIARKKVLDEGNLAIEVRKAQNEKEKAEALASIKLAQENARSQGALLTGLNPEDERKLHGEPLPQVTAVCIKP